jgi:hypothetical protein
MPALPGGGPLIGFRDTLRRGPIDEVPAGDLTTGQVLRRSPRTTTFVFIGWDWATETHKVSVMDDSGARVDRWELAHTEQDIEAAFKRLGRRGSPADLLVGIETTRGLVVDRLLAVHPNAFHAMCPR